jgi:hypothetical protein
MADGWNKRDKSAVLRTIGDQPSALVLPEGALRYSGNSLAVAERAIKR